MVASAGGAGGPAGVFVFPGSGIVEGGAGGSGLVAVVIVFVFA